MKLERLVWLGKTELCRFNTKIKEDTKKRGRKNTSQKEIIFEIDKGEVVYLSELG